MSLQSLDFLYSRYLAKPRSRRLPVEDLRRPFMAATAHSLLDLEPTSEPPRSERVVARSVSPGRPSRIDLVFYAACAAALDQEKVVWDVSCGEDEKGTSLLRSEGRLVVRLNPKRSLVADQPQQEPELAQQEAPDLIVLADVLGYLEQPEQLLLHLSQLAKPSTALWLWEPRSEPTQQLPDNKRRAFSQWELVELVALGGWHVNEVSSPCSTYTTVVASPAPASFYEVVPMSARVTHGTQFPKDAGVDLPPDLASAALIHRARAAVGSKDADRATTLFLEALRISPSNTTALGELAQLSLTCGGITDAVHLLRTCLELDPTNVRALSVWVYLLGDAEPQERLTAFQTLAHLHPSDGEVVATLAQLYAQAGEPLLAIQDLERLRKYHPAPSLDLSLTLGWLLHSVGRTSDAEVEARVAHLIAPESPDVQDLLAALAS